MENEQIEVESKVEDTEDTIEEMAFTGDLYVENSMALQVSAEQNASVENSLVGAAAAGNDLKVTDSAGGVFAAGGDMSLYDAGGMVMVTGGQANVESGFIGVLVSGGETNLNGESKVLATTEQALAFGAALGVVFALLSFLLRRLTR